MKNIFKYLLLAMSVLFLYSSCKKVDDLPFYSNGTPAVLSSSVTTIAPVTADSNKTVVTFSWTSPNYSSSASKQKFIIEIDSSGRNFSKAAKITINDSLSKTFLAKDINNILLGLGFAYNKAYDVDVRLTSSYPNNNEVYQSNVLKIKMTAYLIPPKVVPPASKTLFLVGSATAGGWGNPVPAQVQQFKLIDSVTYEGTFFLNGGGEYLLLPVNGSWAQKYSVEDKTVAGLANGGKFGADLSANFPAPAATGMYKIRFDFQSGTFTVTKVKQYALLYVPGDYQGWSPATAPSLGSPDNDGKYEGYVNIPTGNNFQFKFASTPDWNNAIGGTGTGSGTLGGGNNIAVADAGFYKINANTVANTWSATKTTWGLIGSFSPSNWSNDVPMTYSAADNKWTATITTVAGDQFKFRANGGWTLNYGDDGAGNLVENGANVGDAGKNFAVPAGTHKISLFLNNSGYYTYMVE